MGVSYHFLVDEKTDLTNLTLAQGGIAIMPEDSTSGPPDSKVVFLTIVIY